MTSTAKQWVTIGTLTDIPHPAVARAKARDILIERRDGNAKATAQVQIISDAPASKTVAELLPDYLAYCVSAKKKKKGRPNTSQTIIDKERNLNRHVMPHWGARDIKSITLSDGEDLLDGLDDQPGTQYKIYSMTHHFFSWAVRARLISSHPLEGMGSPYEYDPRDRVLNRDELRWYWRACDEIGYPNGHWGKLLLLTLQRCSTVRKILRSQIDHHRLWHQPKRQTKSKKTEHLVFLSNLAMSIIEEIPNFGADWFFEGKGNTRGNKERIDKLMLSYKKKELLAAGIRNVDHVTIDHWVFHDLRRTGATLMATLGHEKHVVHKILHHSHPSERGGFGMLDQVYIVYDYLPERQKALEKWAEYVEQLIKNPYPQR